MSKPWISDARQRASKRYQSVHADLVRTIIQTRQSRPEPRQERHRAISRHFRLTGDATNSADAEAATNGSGT